MGQHDPWTAPTKSKTFSTGQQWMKFSRAVTPIKRLMEMMMAQMSFRIHPSVRRRMVRAKLDLDHTDEQMDRVPAAEKVLKRTEKDSMGTSQLCFPKPMPMHTETMMHSAKMATCDVSRGA